MGSPAIGWLIAQVTFWVLLFVGWRELGPVRGAAILVAYLAIYLGLPRFDAPQFALPLLALLDIVLVFVVVKGDVRIG
jgi:hypothetical protein